MTPPRVAVLIPTYGYQPVHAEIRRTTFLLESALRGQYGSLDWKEDLYVSAARNELIRQALAGSPDTTHLLFLDADVAPPPGAIAELLKARKPFVSGVYFQKIRPHHPVAGFFDDSEMGWQPLEELKGGLMRVEVVGGGCLLIERRALLALGDDGWFDVDSRGRGEDLRFCRKVADAGQQIYLDASVECVHIGSVPVTREYWERFRAPNGPPLAAPKDAADAAKLGAAR
jgi:GT2 family glycosyltransferase